MCAYELFAGRSNVKKSQHKRNSAQPAELVQALLPHRMPNFMKVFITTHRPHQLAPVKLNDPVEVPAIPIHFAASLPEAVLRGTRKTHYRPKHLADRRSGGRRTTSQVRPKSRGETGTHTIIVNQWDLDSVLQPKRFSLPNTAKPAEETMSVSLVSMFCTSDLVLTAT